MLAVNKLWQISLLLSASSIGIATPALAQESDEETLSNDIIVTAQRRAERLEDVPVSITALQGDALKSAGITNPIELGQLVPGASFMRVGAQVKPSIRGVTSLTSGWTYENGVAIYVDGFYSPDPFSTSNDLSNIKSIQVLKGPQGTLYGRNAMAGAIVIETLDPADVPTAKGSLSFGRYDDVRADGYVSLPISDIIGVSVMGYRRVNDGYLRDIGDNPFSNADDFNAAPVAQTSLRAKMKITPSDALAVTLGYSYAFSDVPAGLVFHPFRNLNANPNPLNLPPYRAIGDFEVSQSVRTQNAVKVRNYTAKVELDTGIGTLTSYTGFNRRSSQLIYDFDGSKLISFQARQEWDVNTGKTFQQTLDYVIDAIDRLDLIVGAFYYRDKVLTGSENYSGSTTTPFRTYLTQLNGTAYAAYLDATYELSDGLFVTAGARYAHEKRFVDFVEGEPGTPSATKTFKDLTPHASIRYELAPRTNVYASYSEGFKSGVFNPNPPSIPVRPEKIKSYEIGFKTAASAWRLDTAAYYYDFKDLHVAVLQPLPGCTLPPTQCPVVSLTSNAEAAEGYGAEVQLTWSPSENLNLRVGGAYNHSEYTDFTNAVGTEFDATGATNLGNGRNVSGQLQDWSGQQMASAPEWTGNVGIDYFIGLGGGQLMLTSNVNYSSSFVSRDPSLWGDSAAPLADPNKQRFRTDSYALVNAQARWTAPSDHFSVAVYCNNCTNTKFETYSSGGAFGDYRLFNEPVTYGVRVGFEY